jgi:hypothetical protein
MPLHPVQQCLHLSTTRCAATTCHAPYLLCCACLLSAPAICVTPLITPPPPVRLRLHLSLHHCLSSRLSCVPYPAGCCVASHHICASCPPAPPTLILPLPLVAPLSCLLSTLAGCCVASPHDSASQLPAPLPPRNSLQAVGLILIVIPNYMKNARPATMRRTSKSFGSKRNQLARWQP